jgi:spermidine synthase
MGGTSSAFSDRRQAHIPLLLHERPRTALFLGLGAGGTLAAVSDHPDLDAECVELIPEIVPLLTYFESSTGPILQNPHITIRLADARRYVITCPRKYDVVVADLFHPARDGAGALYTTEHFQAVKSLLRPDGIFCQWLPLYQMDLAVLRVVIRTFLHVFPDGTAYLAHFSLETPIVGLVGGREPQQFTSDWFERRVTDARFAQRLRSVRLSSGYELFGCFLADPCSLDKFAGKGDLNTDDRPLVMYRAPDFAYADPAPPYVRLLALVDAFKPLPQHILPSAADAHDRAVQRRLASYWAARDSFLRAGVTVHRSSNARRMADQVREPLLALVRQSQDFSAAYDPLLAMAWKLSRTSPSDAAQLLRELHDANPSRSDAAWLHHRLFGEPPHGSGALSRFGAP